MKKLFCLMLAIVMCITGSCFSASAANIDVAYFQDWNFYGRSYPELIYIAMDCDSISFYGEIETPDSPDAPVEEVSCILLGETDPDFAAIYPFDADESVTTYPATIPAGQYYIYFIGSTTVKKEYVLATFTKID